MSSGLLIFAHLLVLGVAILHIGFFVLEAFLWQRPLGLKIFRNSPEKARDSAVLAINQGVYNLFLSVALLAGLVFEHITPALPTGGVLIIYGLGCVVIAGLVGAWTVSVRILWVQAAPALLALVVFALSI